MKTVIGLVKDYVTLTLLGLGVTFAMHEWLGGMLLALAGAAYAMNSDPERDTRELLGVMVGAFLCAHLISLCVNLYFPEFPIQLAMAMAGFFSRRLIGAAFRVSGMVEKKSEKVADRLIDRVLPSSTGWSSDQQIPDQEEQPRKLKKMTSADPDADEKG